MDENCKRQQKEQEGDDLANQKLTKELQRLKEHLVEMSDNYNNEAIQAEEREKKLRMALADAEKSIQESDENVASERYLKINVVKIH